MDYDKMTREELIRENLSCRKQLDGLVESIRQNEDYQQKYVDLVNGSLDGFAMLNQDGHFTFCNSVYCEITGYPFEDLKTKTYQDLTPEEYYELDQRHFNQMLKRGYSDLYEKEYIKSSGERIPIEIRSYLIKAPNGKFSGTWSYVRDISERKQIEEALLKSNEKLQKEIIERKQAEKSLRVSEEKFRILYNSSPDMYVSVSPEDACIKLCNDTLLKETGYTRREIIGAPIHKMYHDDCMDEVKKTFQQFVETGKIANKELILKRKDGSRILVSLNANAVRDKEGKILSSISSWRDITQSKQLENRAKEKEKEYKLLVANLSSGVVVHGPKTEILFSNQMAASLLGLSEEQMRGKKAMDPSWCFLREDGSRMPFTEYPVNAVLSSGKPIAGRLVGVCRPDLKLPTWLICSAYPVHNDHGMILNVVVTFVDITALKRSEDKLRKSEEKYRTLYETMAQGVVYQDIDGHIISANPAALKILGRTMEEIENQTSESELWNIIREDGSVLSGSEHPAIIALKTGQPVMNTVIGVFNPVYNGYVWINVNATPQFRKGEEKPFQVYAIFENITERKKAEDDLKINAERYAKAQEMGRVGNWEYDIVTETFWGSEEARRLFDLDPEIESLSVEDIESRIPERDRVHQALEDLIEYGTPYDLQYELIPNKNNKKILIHAIAELVRDESGNPIKVVGVIQDITEQKIAEEALNDYKEQLSRLNAHLQNFIEQERISIAREIHDDLGQTLSALKMDLGWINKRLLAEQAPLESKIKTMRSIIDQSVQSVKRICSDLRPGILDDLGLISAMQWYIDQFQERSGIQCRLNIDPADLETGKAISIALYRILQEALNNVFKHAYASQTHVSLSQKDEAIVLEISDNGKGFDVNAQTSQSFGIIGMRERAYALNGDFNITINPAGGTCLRIRLPLNAQ